MAALPAVAQQNATNVLFWGSKTTSGSIDQPVRAAYSTGSLTTTAVLQDGSIVSWGGYRGRAPFSQAYRERGFWKITGSDDQILGLRSDSIVSAWSYRTADWTPVVAGVGKATAVAVGLCKLALRTDSTVLAWGCQGASQPYSIPPGLGQVVAIASAPTVNLALTRHGRVYAWGDSSFQLLRLPASTQSQVKEVGAGRKYGLALKQDSSLVSWGKYPLSIPTGLGKVLAIACGYSVAGVITADSSLVILAGPDIVRYPELRGLVSIHASDGLFVVMAKNGEVYTVPFYPNYQPGPQSMPRGLGSIKKIYTSSEAYLFLNADSSLSEWGGAVGLRQSLARIGKVKTAALSYGRVFAVRPNGTLAAWGDTTGRLLNTPQGLTDVKQVAAGIYHALALRANGTVVAWGVPGLPQSQVPLGLSGVVAVAASPYASFALKGNGTVVAWGNPSAGMLNLPAGLRNVVAITVADNYGVALQANGRLVLWGTGASQIGPIPTYWKPITTVSAGYNHLLVKEQDNHVRGLGSNSAEQSTNPGTLRTLGQIAAGRETSALVIDPPQAPLRQLSGRIFQSGNGDCIQNRGEAGLPGTVVVADPGRYYALSDQAGAYTITADSASYRLSQIFPLSQNRRQHQVCPVNNQAYMVSFAGQADSITGLNFANDIPPCAAPEISVSANRRRLCGTNQTVIRYANTGTLPHAQAVAHLRMPRYVYLLSASRAYVRENDSTYRFDLGTLAPNSEGSILIRDSVACNFSLIGREQCTEVWLTPGTPPCQWPLGYDGSEVEALGSCRAGIPTFVLTNTGNSMAATRRYRIFADTSLAWEDRYTLRSGDSIRLQFTTLAGRSNLWVQVEQDSLNPSGQFAVARAACGGGVPVPVEIPREFGGLTHSTDCQPIRYSYDPNDKQVQPAGLTAAGNIEPGTWLRYRIRFMNKGNDTAFAVRVVDTLSRHIDLASIRFGASSHPYVPLLSGKGRPVLTFQFTGIVLPDSARSGAASQGFVDFSVRTNPNAPLGTEIRNFAEIYFDYNDPVRTNTTLNTLYRPVVVPGLIDTLLVSAKPARRALLRVEPNPAHTSLRVLGAGPQPLELLNAEGRRVLYHPSPSGDTLLNIEPLPVGLYLLRQGSSSVRVIKE